MTKHWSERPINYLNTLWPTKSYYKMLKVTKGNEPCAIMVPGKYGAVYSVSISWLQTNFPMAYVKFLSYVMVNSREWNDTGSLIVDPWSEMREDKRRSDKEKASAINDLIQAKGRAIRRPKGGIEEK